MAETVVGLDRAVQAIDGAPLGHAPFPHLVIGELLDPGDAEALLRWLEHDAEWWTQERSFYQHDTCNNISTCPLAEPGGILGEEARAAMATALEARLGVPLDREHPTLGAHRMGPGHGIGIHSDSPELGTEHVRLLLTLRREPYDDGLGGQLLLLEGPRLEDLGAVVLPVHNSAVAFELTGDSYHAVNDVVGGSRYSLVFGFWNREQMRTTSLPARPPRTDDELSGLAGASALIDVLRTSGAAAVAHSGATLLDHLVGVAATLVAWGCSPAICRAGLFHSVYGTATFPLALFHEAERPVVREWVGEEAERLAWLFSTVRFSEVYRREGEDRYLARRRDDVDLVELDRDDIAALNLMAAANMFEQLPGTDISPGVVFEWRSMVDTLVDVLPADAVAELRAVFGEAPTSRYRP